MKHVLSLRLSSTRSLSTFYNDSVSGFGILVHNGDANFAIQLSCIFTFIFVFVKVTDGQ